MMLTTISPDELFGLNTSEFTDVTISGTFRSSENNIVDQAIEEIILNNINIQIALVPPLYPYPTNRNREDYESYVHIIGFLKEQDLLLQIENFKKIFSNIIFLKVDNHIDLCQVNSPFDNAKRVFDNLIKRNKLNRWLTYFMLRPRKDDCSQMGYYRYSLNDKDTKLSLLSEEMHNDNFFSYMFQNERNILQQKAFAISGFTLNEIDNDVYIKALSILVKDLFVMILEDTVDRNPNQTCYVKYLTWV